MTMKSAHALLDEAEDEWREEVRRDHPLWGETEVVREGKGAPGRDWDFRTDLKRIFALIFDDERLRGRFTDIVAKHWEGEPEELLRETLHYLLFHELYHPLEAPFSAEGEENDNKSIHQAIRRGIVAAEPGLSPLDQVMKVRASQNAVKDFILDNRFAVDNEERRYTREDIIPVWDMLELHDSPAKTNFYTITRYLYGALYGPESAHAFFEEKAGKGGAGLAEKALAALLEEKVALPKSGKRGLRRGNGAGAAATSQQLSQYVRGTREVFAGDGRYTGVERLMAVLGPYVEKGMPQGRADQQGESGGASSQDILQDLLEDMSAEEQQAFLDGLGQEMEGFGEGEADSVTGWDISTEELNSLELTTMHEFYKRNHPEVRIVGSSKVGESIVVGKRKSFRLAKSRVITEDEVARLNLKEIARFQGRTRLPVLIPLENGLYRLNEYTLRERDVKDVVYVDSMIDVPDVVELYLDSSGSMYKSGNNEGFNDGSSWDMLSCVLYGYIDALRQASAQLNKQCMIRIHNFADRQVDSRLVPVEEFWRGAGDALKALFQPENGYNVEDVCIEPVSDSKKRAYVIVTDGNLVISGRTARESRKMKELGKHPNNNVILFEIGGTYDLGRAVQHDPDIHYFPVHDKAKMLSDGLEVLLSK